jgi:hypothetical protein
LGAIPALLTGARPHSDLEMVDLVNARPQAIGKLRSVAGGSDRHVGEVRLVTERVVVQGRHLYAVVHKHVQGTHRLYLPLEDVDGKPVLRVAAWAGRR